MRSRVVIDIIVMKPNTLSHLSYEELLAENALLRDANAGLQLQLQELRATVTKLDESLSQAMSQIDWFKRQLFGKSSEKFYAPDVSALPLFANLDGISAETDNQAELSVANVVVLKRKPRGKTKDLGDNTESGLRFDEGVEIITENIFPDEVKGLSEEAYEVIDSEISDRLVSRKSRRVVLRRVFHKVKIKRATQPQESSEASNVINLTSVIIKTPVPEQALNRSYMAESFLVDMLLDKILNSLPLYRQHQSLTREGFHVSRGVLTKNLIRTCSIFGRVVEALRYSILTGRVIAIDETPMRVEVDRVKHRMKKGYVWPIYGDLNEIVYHYNESRSASVISTLLGANFKGTILSDGYPAYNCYVKGVAESNLGVDVVHATCWVHARRTFVKLERAFPEVYQMAMQYIGALYDIEMSLSNKSSSEIAQARISSSKPIVDDYFNWLKGFSASSDVAMNRDLRNALSYSIERESSMREFLINPKLSMDTNYLEREIRPIAIGRKNWMFCWTEIGAQCLCDAQSLVRTCLLQGVDPRTYLIDILQRLTLLRPDDEDVSDLIPRLWKDNYAKNPIPCPCEAIICNKPA